MSAWSSATGRAQLSYADRLRQASMSNAPSKHVSSTAPREDSKASLSTASLARPSAPSRRLSSVSSTSSPTASGSASRPPATPSDSKAGSPSSAEPTLQSSSGSAVNVWEARRKQLADREAEKERERQSALANQSKPSPGSAASASLNVGSGGNKPKQTATGPRKATERHSKGSNSSNQSDRKSNKQPNSSSIRTSNTVPISSPMQIKANTATAPSNLGSLASLNQKTDSRSIDQARASVTKAHTNASDQARQAIAPNNEAHFDQAREAAKPTDAAHASLPQPDQAATTSEAAQKAAAQLPPSSAPAVQTAPTSSLTHDDIPASPATVASAIEEVLRNGGASHGAQTEDDDAWLARIHLLNGGQNMPKFGGFGPNGVAGHSDEAEKQAAKKAERAVAAAWGAGKNVWNKSQQPDQQSSRVYSHKDAPPATSSTDRMKDTPSQGYEGAAVQADKKHNSTNTSASISVNGINHQGGVTGNLSTTESQNSIATGDDPQNAEGNAALVKKQTQDKSSAGLEPQRKGARAAGAKSTVAATNVPSFDANNWPSPLDAGMKSGEKPRAPVVSVEHDRQDAAGKQIKSGTQKSLKETLDELQVRLAPGVNPQQTGANAGAKKGKQQWVPILPEITHASTNAASTKPSRSAADAKQGKSSNKQQQQPPRKEGGKGAGQTQQVAQGGKKDAANKTKDRSKAKESAAEGNAGSKAADSLGKNEVRNQTASLDRQAVAGVPTEASARSEAPKTTIVPTKLLDASSLSQSEVRKPGSSSSTESAPVSGEKQTSVSARGDSPTKHSQQARTQLRLGANDNSQPSLRPNGVVPPRSGASSGTGTPVTNNSSRRGSVVSSPQIHGLPRVTPSLAADVQLPLPIFYGPSGAAAPMNAPPAPWLPYNNNPYAQARPVPFLFDSTQQTGATLPADPLGKLLTQIEFYFSQHNLQGDFFLRQKMDAQGWVAIAVVAGFKRVQAITTEVAMVKDALLHSAVLDVDGMRVRRRYGWELYTLPTAASADNETTRTDVDDDDEPLGIVSASGFGGRLDP